MHNYSFPQEATSKSDRVAYHEMSCHATQQYFSLFWFPTVTPEHYCGNGYNIKMDPLTEVGL